MNIKVLKVEACRPLGQYVGEDPKFRRAHLTPRILKEEVRSALNLPQIDLPRILCLQFSSCLVKSFFTSPLLFTLRLLLRAMLLRIIIDFMDEEISKMLFIFTVEAI